MPKHRTRASRALHPSWCHYAYDGSDDRHDPHLSTREHVDPDFPSDLAIDAYLIQTRKPSRPHPDLADVAIEFQFPGEETAQFLMTFGQLRRLTEALARLIRLGEIEIFPSTGNR